MYIVIGGDGKEYGPKASVEVRDWIAEGRLNAQSQIKEQGDDEWKVLGSLQEFAADFAGSNPAIPQMGVTPPPQIHQHPMVGNPATAQAMVNGPATFMMVLAIISLIILPIGVILNLVRGPDPNLPDWIKNLQGTAGIINHILSFVANIFILIGAIKMKKCQSYGLAMTASILCTLFNCGCCCLGLGAGIWSIVVLSKPEVKAAFR